MKTEDLPFKIGSTWADAGTPTSADAPQLEGKEYCIEYDNVNSGDIIDTTISGRSRWVRIVRNVTGSNLLPKRLARMKVDGTGNQFLSQVNGYADTVGQIGYPIDEFLPAAGVADQGLFFVVVEGPAKVTSGPAGDTTIAIGSMVIPTTDGKVIDQDTTVAAGAATFNQIQGAIGRAITAVAAINSDFLISVRRNG